MGSRPTSFCTAREIAQLQCDAVERWHRGPLSSELEDASHGGLLSWVCQQHEQNFRLWHEEDRARSRSAGDAEIAAVKRRIDQLNQRRNDLIEELDDRVASLLAQQGVAPPTETPINSETPGSVIDRLSILALRLYHYQEQLQREDVDADHRERVTARLQRCREQHADLTDALQRLWDDLLAGRLRHKTYRQMKMYNDPSLNPALYRPE